ncbi:MAG TPA: nucleotide pyrophosphohydrolase [Gammaproteobacteria bacterium]|nr:nucleotide pyrophosphohydrolase [Gammaproteobacteria bacterium]
MTDIIDVNHIKQLLKAFTEARQWGQYHTPKNLTMALAGEAGELLEIFQWLTDKESIEVKNKRETKEHISHELADIMLYVIHIANVLDINLNEALHHKISLNEKKYPADLVKGSAKKYSSYNSDPK